MLHGLQPPPLTLEPPQRLDERRFLKLRDIDRKQPIHALAQIGDRVIKRPRSHESNVRQGSDSFDPDSGQAWSNRPPWSRSVLQPVGQIRENGPAVGPRHAGKPPTIASARPTAEAGSTTRPKDLCRTPTPLG